MTLLLPPVLFAASALAMGVARAVVPGPALMDWPASALGLAVMAAGGVVSVGAARHVMRRGTTVRPRQDPSVLVTDGPFRWTRNPMYLGLSVILTGLGLLLGTLVPFVIVPVFIVAVDRLHIRFEEALLRQRFGEAFDAYARATRRWI